MKYFPIFLFTTFLLAFACKTKPHQQNTIESIDPIVIVEMWKKIDSLESNGLVSSALEQVREIKRIALASQASDHLIKAVLHENRYLTQLEEDSETAAIARAEAELEMYPEPAKSVMHSLVAQWYTSYLQTHLWKLRNRTEYGGVPGPDLHTWGIRHFLDKIESHYTSSVQWEGLHTAGVQEYLILLRLLLDI